jgi:hypothetical protein
MAALRAATHDKALNSEGDPDRRFEPGYDKLG